MRFCAEFVTLFTLLLSWLVANLVHFYYNQSDPRSWKERKTHNPEEASEKFHPELSPFGELGPSSGTCVNCGEPHRQRQLVARQFGTGDRRGHAEDFLKVLIGFVLTSVWVVVVTLIIHSGWRHRMDVRFIIELGLTQFAVSRRRG